MTCYCPPEDNDPCCGLCGQGVDCSMTEEVKLPAEWETKFKIQIMDPDGWRQSASLGPKSFFESITREEFIQRKNESTVRYRK